MLTPILMWLWASFIGWIIVQRVLLRPLKRIQNAISAYKPGDPTYNLPSPDYTYDEDTGEARPFRSGYVNAACEGPVGVDLAPSAS